MRITLKEQTTYGCSIFIEFQMLDNNNKNCRFAKNNSIDNACSLFWLQVCTVGNLHGKGVAVPVI